MKKYPVKQLEVVSKVLALLVCVGLLLAASILIFNSYRTLFGGAINQAIQDGLFVLILLEMFFVVRSFIKYGSINVSLVINIGIIAAVKEMVFQLKTLDLHVAIGFAVIFLSLGFVYLMETVHFSKKKSH